MRNARPLFQKLAAKQSLEFVYASAVSQRSKKKIQLSLGTIDAAAKIVS